VSRILLIEDDPGNRMVLRSRLSDQGYDVVAVENGAKGLIEARGGAFHLFLVASGMTSGIDGLEVCRRLKASPETHAVPTVLFTNKASSPEEVDRGYEAGCEAFVTRAEQGAIDHVIRMLLRLKGQSDRLSDELRSLESQNKRLLEERQRSAEPEPVRETGEHLQALREVAAGRPDGLVVVDSEGCVRHADRGACELLGNRIEGQHLGSLAPASGLEAFARDARTELRTGFRFDLATRPGQTPRSLMATVVPLMSPPGQPDAGLKVLLMHDAAKRKLATELLHVEEPCLPRREAGPLVEAAREVYSPAGLIGASPAMGVVRAEVVRASASSDPVLVVGEKGTGRERVARTLHYTGSSTGALLQLNCSAVAPENVEDELFGHVRGALPGAAEDRPGLFQRAQDGTLVLEEIGDLGLDVQQKVLDVLRDGRVHRTGGTRPERVDVRLIATSSRSLEGAVREGRFLTELQDRLAGLTIELPPLRERDGDVDQLARHFVARFGSARGVEDLTEEVLWVLSQYAWPGNVRELRDCIDQACARARESEVGFDDLPGWLVEACGRPDHDLIPRPAAAEAPAARYAAGRRELRPWDITDEDPVSLDLYEKKALLRAIAVAGGDKLAAARLLKVGKSTLYRKLKRFDIQ
jgi:DNA-binding NtrC family response regulator